MRWFVGVILAFAVSSISGASIAQTAPLRLALVVGVSDYGRDRAAQEAAGFFVPAQLTNAVSDAEIVAAALEDQHFTVTRVMDPDKRALLAAVNAFGNALRASDGSLGVFYFAGHGAQGRSSSGRDVDNYLIPVSADLITETDLASEALGLERLSTMAQAGPDGATILIFDACRNFALPAATRNAASSQGLAQASAESGMLVAYSTSPGDVAVDGNPGENGPYARALAARIRAAAATRIEDIFISVRNAVREETDGNQVPWENASLHREVRIGVQRAPTEAEFVRALSQLSDARRDFTRTLPQWARNGATSQSAYVEISSFLRHLDTDRVGSFITLVGEGNPSRERAELLANALLARRETLARAGIDTPQRFSGFMAQVAVETGNFRFFEENFNYSFERLKSIHGQRFDDDDQIRAYANRPEMIASRVYANRWGNGDEASRDGWVFRARGAFQSIGRSGYVSTGALLGVDLVSNPDRLADPEFAFAAAALWWSANGANQLADRSDSTAISRLVVRGDANYAEPVYLESVRERMTVSALEHFSRAPESTAN